jgi:hypothetical protein
MLIAIIFVISLVALGFTAAHAMKTADQPYKKTVAVACGVGDDSTCRE